MIYIAAIAVYLAALIAIGAFKASRVRTQADFSVAGRTLSPWVLVGTMLATWVGTGSILGNAGKAYQTGLAAVLLPLGSVLGVALLTRIAARVRATDSFTVPELIGERFGALARVLAVIALCCAYMVIVSYQYNAGGAVLETVLVDSAGEPLLSTRTATIIAAVFIIAYTALAGLLSVAYTDLANGVLIVLSLIVALPFLLHEAGGIAGMDASFAAMNRPQHMQLWGVYSGIDLVNFCLPPFLLVLGDANMYQRFSAARDQDAARRATTALVVAVLVVEVLIIVEAWIGASLIHDAENGRHVLIYAAHRHLPPVLGAVLLTTIVGIIISTADSYLLVPATTLIRDVYLRHVSPGASEKWVVFASRMLVVGLGLVAYAVSVGFSRSAGFFERALYAYTIYGTAITPALVAALFWRGATREGAIASIASGTAVTLAWKEWDGMRAHLPAWMSQLDEVLPAITVSVACLVAGSLLARRLRGSRSPGGSRP